MQTLHCDELWPRLKELCRKAERRSAAVAFYSDGNALKFRKGDVLIVDASDGRIKSGETTVQALRRAASRKANIYSLPGLHAKVFVFDGTAVIGSANVSENSQSVLIEAALVTNDSATVSQAKALIESLKAQAQPVDGQFIKRIAKIKVHSRPRGSNRGKKTKVGHLGKGTWVMGVAEMEEDAFPEEEERAEAGRKIAKRARENTKSDVNWTRWTVNDKFSELAVKGDSVIEIVEPLGKGKIKAFPSAPILHRQEEPTCTRFYIEEAPGREKLGLSLKQFRALAKAVGIPGKISDSSRRLLTEDKARLITLMWSQFRTKTKNKK